MVVAQMPTQIVLFDHLAHVLQDLGGCGDRLGSPWFEAVAVGVEVAVGTDARIAMGHPGAAIACVTVKHHEA